MLYPQITAVTSACLKHKIFIIQSLFYYGETLVRMIILMLACFTVFNNVRRLRETGRAGNTKTSLKQYCLKMWLGHRQKLLRGLLHPCYFHASQA